MAYSASPVAAVEVVASADVEAAADVEPLEAADVALPLEAELLLELPQPAKTPAQRSVAIAIAKTLFFI